MIRRGFSKFVAATMVATFVACAGVNLVGDNLNLTKVVHASEQSSVRLSSVKFNVRFTRVDWKTGHNGFINLTAQQTLKNWVLEFDYDGEITSAGNCDIERDGDHYRITPKHWNTTLIRNKELKLDYLGKKSNGATGITNVVLYDDENGLVEVKQWKLKEHYNVGDVVEYKGKFYKCRQEHTVDAPNWYPSINTAALWSVDRTIKAYNVDVSK